MEATWAEVDVEGLAGLSLDKVAARAGVSKATIYRRWRSKEALVLDAWRIAIANVHTVPDTGSLRGDLTALFVAKQELFDHQPMTILLPQMVARRSGKILVIGSASALRGMKRAARASSGWKSTVWERPDIRPTLPT